MPEQVHLLLSEPKQGALADAIHYLKLSLTGRLDGTRKRGFRALYPEVCTLSKPMPCDRRHRSKPCGLWILTQWRSNRKLPSNLPSC